MSVVPSAAPEKPYVFISYARGDNYDRHLARQLDEALRIRKIEVFRDQSSLEIGDVWPDKLQNALARATHFVVFLSAEARQSRWVNYEIDAAVARPREELRIVGIRRSTSAEFPQLANIEVRLCEYGQELETVFRVFGMPWEEDGRVLTSSRLRESRTQSKLLAQLCDRVDVETSFRESYLHFLRMRPWMPQAHFVVGRKDEEHDSLVERLTWTYLEDEAKTLTESHDAPVFVKTIDWPKPWTVVHNRAALVASIFDQFFTRYSREPNADLTSAGFSKKIAEHAPFVVALVHTISEKGWGERTPRLLADYLRFWREIGGCDGRRLFFLFFNVQVCHARSEEGQPKCDRCGPVYTAVEKIAGASLRTKTSGIPSTLLPLHCVSKFDVGEWFEDREDVLAAQHEAVCARLFSSGDCQPMTAVEQALRDVQIAHLRRAS